MTTSTALFAELKKLNSICWHNFQANIPWQADILVFERKLKELHNFELASLATDSQKKAFWINLYHILIKYLIVKLALRKSIVRKPWLFWWYRVRVGDYFFSLDDIEHGILRANSGHPVFLFPPFWAGDKRKQYMCSQRDYRVHFVLNCGAKSCPTLRDIAIQNLDTQLDLAEYEFAKTNFVVDNLHKKIRASKLFDWYRGDFAGIYLDDPTYLDYEVNFEPYDWSVAA